VDLRLGYARGRDEDRRDKTDGEGKVREKEQVAHWDKNKKKMDAAVGQVHERIKAEIKERM